MGQQMSLDKTAKTQGRRGELKAISFGLLGSALAMACSFGEVSGPDTGGGFDDPVTNVPGDNTPDGNDDDGVSPPATTGTGNPTADPPPRSEVSPLEQNVMDMLALNCASCHTASNYGNMSYITDRDKLIANGKIIPGDSENSPLVRRVVSGQMPPSAILNQRPSPADIEQLKIWIDGLSENVEPVFCADNEFVSFDSMYTSMLNDIQEQDSDDRPFIRYVGVAQSWNSKDCNFNFEREQYAFLKVINSISTKSRLTVPVSIDNTGLIYRIDIRDYNWDRAVTVQPGDELAGVVNNETPLDFADAWEAIINFSQPYAVEFQGEQADVLKQQTQTLVPYIPSNAFIEATMTQQLYFALIEAPATFQELLAQFDLDAVEQIEDGLSARAGMISSGVSKQERVVERYDIDAITNGFMWVSYDLADQIGLANDSIFSDPVGFDFAGGEMIYSLPNGQHAYYVAAADGQRLTEAPVDVVTDPAQVKQQGAVTNGVSCMSCHKYGMIPFADLVRDHVEDNALDFDDETFEIVQEVYPPKAEMDALVKFDQDNFVVKMEAAGVPTNIADPVMDTYLNFVVRPLNTTHGAAELGVTTEVLEANMRRLDPGLQNLTEGTLERTNFSNLYFESLCILQANAENQPANCP